eukprot:172581-Prymnesium_polylepis.2
MHPAAALSFVCPRSARSLVARARMPKNGRNCGGVSWGKSPACPICLRTIARARMPKNGRNCGGLSGGNVQGARFACVRVPYAADRLHVDCEQPESKSQNRQ